MVNDFHPKNMFEALMIKKEHPEATWYAGGSDLMVTKRFTETIIFLNQMEDLKQIKSEQDILKIGSGVTYRELLAAEEIPACMKAVIGDIASPAIRNIATMGGNICNASPAGDTLPLLYAFDALLVLQSLAEDGTIQQREVPIDQFILGIRKISLRPDEILCEIQIKKERIPNQMKDSLHIAYKKVAARKAQAISKVQFVGMIQMDGQVVSKLRFAFGAVGVTVVRKKEIEELYLGLTIEQLKLKISEIRKKYEECLHPIDDQRSTADYRKKVCLNLLEDFLEQYCEGTIH